MVSRIFFLIRKVFLKRIWVAVLIFIFLVVARGTWNMYQKAQFAKNNRDFVVAKLENATSREKSLQAELKKMDSSRGVEASIRQSFDVGKSGEKLLVLVDAPKKDKKPPIKKLTIWGKVVHFLRIK